MNCADFRGMLSPFLDAELTFTEQKYFSEHRSQCETCDALVVSMGLTKQYLGKLVSVALPSDFVARLQARLSVERDERPSLWQRFIEPKTFGLSPASISGLVAASITMLLIGTSLLTQQTAPLLEPDESSLRAASPAAPIPASPAQTTNPTPLLTNTAVDTSMKQATPKRDFSRQIKYVDKTQNPN